MEASDDELQCTPPEITEAAKKVSLNLLPESSRKVYEQTYEKFKAWCSLKKVKKTTENVILAYLSEKSKKLKSSSLWSEFSMLKATLSVKEGVDASKFLKVRGLLKNKSVGYRAKISKIFTRPEIEKYLREAPDETHLIKKVVLILSVAGRCRREELTKLTVDDIEDNGSILIVNIPDTKTHKNRKFTVTDHSTLKFLDINRRYSCLRPANTTNKRFFFNYRNGKCSTQVVGINTIGKVPSEIAKFLQLPDPQNYTGHVFRRSSATLLADAGADITRIKMHGGWRSSTVAEGYIEDSLPNKIKMANQILGESSVQNVSSVVAVENKNRSPKQRQIPVITKSTVSLPSSNGSLDLNININLNVNVVN